MGWEGRKEGLTVSCSCGSASATLPTKDTGSGSPGLTAGTFGFAFGFGGAGGLSGEDGLLGEGGLLGEDGLLGEGGPGSGLTLTLPGPSAGGLFGIAGTGGVAGETRLT